MKEKLLAPFIDPCAASHPKSANHSGVVIWEKFVWRLMVIFAIADSISISVAQIAATLMGICWVAVHVKAKTRPSLPPMTWSVAMFVLTSLISAMLSLNMRESLIDSKDLTHFAILFIVYDYMTRHREKITSSLAAILAGGGVAAVYGLSQAATRGVNIDQRISGFQDIYITFAGILMLAITVAAAIFFFHPGKKLAVSAAGVACVMVVAAIASLTRNAMLGMMAGVTVVLALRKPVALLLLPIVAAAVLILSPEVVRNRIMSITDLNDSSIRERLYVWRAGVEIIRDNPLFGVGQNSFPLVYPKYRRPDVKEPNISNLHNNFLELGAERGLVGLTVWIWLWVATAWAMFKGWRGAPVAGRMAKAAGLGSLTAFMTAGLFEFNFGTAMVQMMMFYITGVALAASRAD